jgi:hypothetical protein
MDSNGNCSRRLPDSDHSARFQQIPAEFPWNWKLEWLRLQPTEFRRIPVDSDIPLGIRRNSWGMVKTSRRWGRDAYQCSKTTNDKFLSSSVVWLPRRCGDVAPGSYMRDVSGREVSLLTSALIACHRSWELVSFVFISGPSSWFGWASCFVGRRGWSLVLGVILCLRVWKACGMLAKGTKTRGAWAHSPIRQRPWALSPPSFAVSSLASFGVSLP